VCRLELGKLLFSSLGFCYFDDVELDRFAQRSAFTNSCKVAELNISERNSQVQFV